MPRNNLRQAMVPDGGEVLENPNGSAPGLWIEHDAHVVVLLPGPPRELKPMLTSLTARLAARASGQVIVRRSLHIAGQIESQVDQALHPLYGEWAAWSPPVAATILAKLGQIDLHLSVRHTSAAEGDGDARARHRPGARGARRGRVQHRRTPARRGGGRAARLATPVDRGGGVVHRRPA